MSRLVCTNPFFSQLDHLALAPAAIGFRVSRVNRVDLTGPFVVRSPNWLGDAVMALPAVRNLKTRLGQQELTVATPRKLASLWAACPFVDHVLPLDQPRKLIPSVRQLRTKSFRTGLLLPNSLRSAAELWGAGIPQRIGYGHNSRHWLLTRPIALPARQPTRLHQRDYYLDLVGALDAPTDESLPRLVLPSPSSALPTGPYLAICPGAEYGPAKRWPILSFAEVARHYQTTRGWQPLILGAAGDRPIAEALLALLPGAESRAGATSLGEFMALLAGAQLLLCNDSGAMHLASALRVPAVAIFGSTEPQLTGPLGSTTRVVRHHVPCSPCFRRRCPIDFSCMHLVTPAHVLATAESGR